MISKNLLNVALVCASVTFGTLAVAQAPAAAPAKAAGTPQSHHCKQADGTMDMGKTKKACLAAKGTWLKDANKAAPSAPAAGASAAAKK